MGNRNDGDRSGRHSHDDHDSHAWWNPPGHHSSSIRGTNGNDLLVGTPKNDRMDGRRGDDVIHGLDGNDKIKGSSGDDIIYGGKGNDQVDGGRGDDEILGGDGNDTLKGGDGSDLLDGGAGNDRLEGGKDDDILIGGAGNDVLYGNGGSDVLLGGDGNDVLYGSDKGGGHFPTWFWWLCRPATFEDFLDGGAGNDKLYAAGGNDLANYTLAENIGASDLYDGGKGEDTLQMSLTSTELNRASVQQDIQRFEAFLDRYGNEWKDNGPTFHFSSFDLDARNFERLEINLINTAPSAADDGCFTTEDAPLTVPAGTGLLSNDTDPDAGDVLTADAIPAGTSALGAAFTVNADGSYSYDPTGVLQSLKAGQSVVDTFQYTVRDLAGASSTATARITVTGSNDAPIAGDDAYVLDEDHELQIDPAAGVHANDVDVDGEPLSAVLYEGPAHGMVALNPDGSFTYTPDANYHGTDTFQYRTNDGLAPSGIATVTLTNNSVQDSPIAVLDEFIIFEDEVISVGNPGILGNDIDEDDDTLVITASDFPFGTVPDATGQFIFGAVNDPASQDLHDGETLVREFHYTIEDGNGGTDTGTVRVTVLGINDAPESPGFITAVSEDEVLFMSVDQLLMFATDVEEDALMIVGMSGPGAGFTYDPRSDPDMQALAFDEIAELSASFTISDGHGGLTDVPILITVVGANDDPDAVGDTRTTSEETVITGNVLANDTDVDGDTLSVVNVGTFSTALGGSITLAADGSYTYDPRGSATLQALNQGQSLVDTFEYVVRDTYTDIDTGLPATDSATLSITVNGVDEPAPQSNNVVPSVSDASALDFYIRFDLPEQGMDEWLHLESFNLGFEMPTSIGSGGGGVGRVDAEGLGSTLGNSATATLLARYLAQGKFIEGVELEVYKDGPSGAQLIEEYQFSDVLLGKLNTGGVANDPLSHDMVFEFSGFTHQFYNDSLPGGASGTTKASADFLLSKSGSGPNVDQGPDADIEFLQPEAGPLEYYARFEGSDGWLRLDGFSMGLEAPVSPSSGGGGGAGRATHSDVTLQLGTSALLTALQDKLFDGKTFQTVEIEAYQSDGLDGRILVDEFRFDSAILSRLDTANAAQNTLDFNYASFTHAHIDPDGDLTEAGWNFATNKIADAPTPHPDVDII